MNTAAVQQVKRPLPEGFIQALQDKFGERCSSTPAVLGQHCSVESPYPTMAREALIYAHSTDEVAWVAHHCHTYHVPLIPYGAGTSLEGHVLAIQGGISLDLSEMDVILAIHAEDFTSTVQAGVRRETFNAALAETGMFFPIDPSANATFGGFFASLASAS